jgi:hypothetical protein
MRLYLDSFYFLIIYPMGNLSKKISLAKQNAIRRREKKERREREGSFVFLSIKIREQRNHSKMKVRKRSFRKN